MCRASAGLPPVHETALLDLGDLPTLVPLSSTHMQSAVDPMGSLDVHSARQRPPNSMHPDAYTAQLQSHRARHDETDAVRSLLSVSTEPSSSSSGGVPGSKPRSEMTNQMHHHSHDSEAMAASSSLGQPMRGGVSVDDAVSIAYTDLGSKTPSEVEALPGQQSKSFTIQ